MIQLITNLEIQKSKRIKAWCIFFSLKYFQTSQCECQNKKYFLERICSWSISPSTLCQTLNDFRSKEMQQKMTRQHFFSNIPRSMEENCKIFKHIDLKYTLYSWRNDIQIYFQKEPTIFPFSSVSIKGRLAIVSKNQF